jgi:hypothetical protein
VERKGNYRQDRQGRWNASQSLSPWLRCALQTDMDAIRQYPSYKTLTQFCPKRKNALMSLYCKTRPALQFWFQINFIFS